MSWSSLFTRVFNVLDISDSLVQLSSQVTFFAYGKGEEI